MGSEMCIRDRIIIGEDEAAAGDYTLKNMVTGEQKRLSLEQVSAEIKADA